MKFSASKKIVPGDDPCPAAPWCCSCSCSSTTMMMGRVIGPAGGSGRPPLNKFLPRRGGVAVQHARLPSVLLVLEYSSMSV